MLPLPLREAIHSTRAEVTFPGLMLVETQGLVMSSMVISICTRSSWSGFLLWLRSPAMYVSLVKPYFSLQAGATLFFPHVHHVLVSWCSSLVQFTSL